MTEKQARALPVGIRVGFAASEPYLIRRRWTSAPGGTVLVNDPEADDGFLVRWDDGKEGWIDYRDAKDVFVPGFPGTKQR